MKPAPPVTRTLVKVSIRASNGSRCRASEKAVVKAGGSLGDPVAWQRTRNVSGGRSGPASTRARPAQPLLASLPVEPSSSRLPRVSGPEPLERRVGPRTWGEQSDPAGPRQVCEGSDQWGPRHSYRESLMIRALTRRLKGKRVLNAGCGAGSLSMRLLEKGLDVTSMDASEPSIERLTAELASSFPGRHAPVLLSDIGEMPFADAEFDGVVCGEVLEHLDDERPAVAELARVLRPGGVLVATVPANPWRYDWFDHWVGHRRRYTADGLKDLLLSGGFERVEVSGWGFPLSGLFYRVVYRRLMRRRLERTVPGQLGDGSASARWLSHAVRPIFELDTLFLGRRPGYFGLLAISHAPEIKAQSQKAR